MGQDVFFPQIPSVETPYFKLQKGIFFYSVYNDTQPLFDKSQSRWKCGILLLRKPECMFVPKLETPDDIIYGFKSILKLKSHDMGLKFKDKKPPELHSRKTTAAGTEPAVVTDSRHDGYCHILVRILR